MTGERVLLRMSDKEKMDRATVGIGIHIERSRNVLPIVVINTKVMDVFFASKLLKYLNSKSKGNHLSRAGSARGNHADFPNVSIGLVVC